MIPANRMDRGRGVTEPPEPLSPQKSAGSGGGPPDLWAVVGLSGIPPVELDARIRAGWELWCDLLEELVHTDGMLPSRQLAGRLVAFFEDTYWRAEEARGEVLRRQFEQIPVAAGPSACGEVL